MGWWGKRRRRPPSGQSPYPAAHLADPQPLASVGERAYATVSGTVRQVVAPPGGDLARFVIVLSDGTEEVQVHWMGRSRIVGVTVGARLTVRGRIGRARGGIRVMYNPRYELLATA